MTWPDLSFTFRTAKDLNALQRKINNDISKRKIATKPVNTSNKYFEKFLRHSSSYHDRLKRSEDA